MFGVDLAFSEYAGRVVALRGKRDAVDVAAVADTLAAAADRDHMVIADVARLTFIDAGGVAAVSRTRRNAPYRVAEAAGSIAGFTAVAPAVSRT